MLLHSNLGVAYKNNSLESFNATIKRIYTLGVRPTLPALYDIFEQFTLDVSLDVISGRKEYEMLRIPTQEVMNNAKQIDDTAYVVILMSATLIQRIFCYEMQYIIFSTHGYTLYLTF
jgi:hypothetical protein